MAPRLLQGALEHALDDPTVTQQHQHVGNKLMLEYIGPSESEQVDGISINALVDGIKARVASRWRVEAMEKQKMYRRSLLPSSDYPSISCVEYSKRG